MNEPWMPQPGSEIPGPHLDEDLVADLLLDLPADPEWNEAVRHLSACPQCQDLLQRRGAVWERLRSSRGSAAALAGAAAVFEKFADRQLEPRRAAPESAGVPAESGSGWGRWREAGRRLALALRRPRTAWALGTVALGAAGVLLLSTSHRTSVRFPADVEWLPSASETLALRDDADRTRGTELKAALSAYDRRDLTAAIRGLSAAETSGSMNNLRLVFLGSALARAGDFSKAVQVLESVPLSTLPDPWYTESYWTLLVALHRSGNRTAADSLLHALADQPGEVGGRARRLLGRSEP